MTLTSLIASLVWFMICLLILLFSVFETDATFRLYYSNAIQTFSAMLSAVICYRTMAAYPKGSALAKVWFFLGSGVLAWGLGAILFSSYPLINQGAETPYPWFSDIGYLACPILIIVALVLLNRTLGLAAPSWGIVAAGVLFMAALAASLTTNWEGFFEEGFLLPLVSVAYMLFDPVLLFIIVFTASTFRSGAVGEAWWYVVSGLIIYFLGNVAYTYFTFTGEYATGSPVDISWPLGFGLIALAAVVNRNLLLGNK